MLNATHSDSAQRSTTQDNQCTCGNCPAIRLARGLKPFCRMSRESAPAPEGVYGSYGAAAEARKDGQRIQSIRVSGGPKRFVLVEVMS